MEIKKQSAISNRMLRRKEIKVDFARNKGLYLLFLPVFIYYLIFAYGPLYGALIAFKDFSPVKGVLGSPWVGFKHFIRFFIIPTFWTVLKNTITISISTLIFSFPMPIILALLMNELRNHRFAKLVQNATYLPHFISLVVTCGIVKDFVSDTGIVTTLLSHFGVPQVTLLNYPQYFVPIYVVSGIWSTMGWSSVIYLSALTSIDATLYEAAEIDGAGKWRQVLHITLPGILPTIITMFILQVGKVMNVGHEKILLLSNDSILDVTEVISTYVYRVGLLKHSYSYSTAVNMFNSILNLALLSLANRVSKKVSEVSLW